MEACVEIESDFCKVKGTCVMQTFMFCSWSGDNAWRESHEFLNTDNATIWSSVSSVCSLRTLQSLCIVIQVFQLSWWWALWTRRRWIGKPVICRGRISTDSLLMTVCVHALVHNVTGWLPGICSQACCLWGKVTVIVASRFGCRYWLRCLHILVRTLS